MEYYKDVGLLLEEVDIGNSEYETKFDAVKSKRSYEKEETIFCDTCRG